MSHIRTSLGRAPSSYTPEQMEARAKMAQVEAASIGVLLVRLDDPRLDDWERQFCRNLTEKLVGTAMFQRKGERHGARK